MSDQSVSARPSKQARHEELISAAFSLFIERGFAATRLEDVALKAGVAKGTVVVHFPTKEALFTAVVLEHVTPSVQRAESLRDAPGSPRERIVGLVRFIHDSLQDPHVGGIPKLIVAEVGNFPDLGRSFHEQVCERSRMAVTELIRQGIAAGEFRIVDPGLAARLLLDPLIMHAIWRHSLGRYEPDCVDSRAFLDTHLDIFLRGIAAEV
jgi:AcrR family transcriptional regulator